MNSEMINNSLTALSQIDTDIKRTVKLIGPPSERCGENSFIALLSIIIGQQISTKAAEAIKGRVFTLAPQITAPIIVALDDQALRDAGLSWRKVEYVKGLAHAVTTGALDIESLNHKSTDEVIADITNLRGFGRWSAEIYLMFSLKRLDIFPADDLGILLGLAHLKGLDTKPTPKQARNMTEHWAPHRSVGALFLWFYYHQVVTK